MNIEPVMYFILTLFGIPYAVYIYFYPMRRVWVSVVIGESAVATAISIMILVKTGDAWLALSPFFANFFAGIWQIGGQEARKFHTEALADKIIHDINQSSEGDPLYEL